MSIKPDLFALVISISWLDPHLLITASSNFRINSEIVEDNEGTEVGGNLHEFIVPT
jgi:hypothetical protein